MTLDQRMRIFEDVSKEMIEGTGRLVDFHILALQGRGFRVHMQLNKAKRGFALPEKITLKDYTARFEEHLIELLKE